MWTRGFKILNPDRTSLWASSQEHLAAGTLLYPALKLVRPKPGMGPIAVFDDPDQAHWYWHYVRRLASGNEPHWADAIIVECIFRESSTKRFYIDREKITETKATRGSCYAAGVICLE